MSKDLTKALKRPVKDASEAIQFLKDTFYVANLNLNPDLGFVKANNKSAFKKLTDEQAQLAQMRLVECEKWLRKLDADIWEICIEFSIVTAHIWDTAMSVGHGLKTEEWLDILHTVHENQLSVNGIPMLAEESAEVTQRRRSQFVMDSISRLHSKHPEMKGAPTEVPMNGAKAVLICTSILPNGFEEKLNEFVQHLGGYSTKQFDTKRSDIAQEAKKALDDAVMEFDEDYDDDPTRGMEW